MKTRLLVIYISIASLLLVIFFSFLFKLAIDEKDKTLLKNNYIELKKGTENMYLIKSSFVEKYVFDNSFWTELLQATAAKDTAWLNDDFFSSLPNYGVDYMWVINKQGELIYSKYSGTSTTIAFLPIDFVAFKKSISKQPFNIFHEKIDGFITQIFTAPIQPSSDEKRITPHAGYIILGRRYDKSYTDEFSKLSMGVQFEIEEHQNIFIDSINFKNNTVKAVQPLYDFSGKKIATLKSTKSNKLITTYNTYLKNYTLIYLSLLILLLLGYYSFIRKKILLPVKILAEALYNKSSAHLKPLKNKKDEFADIALMLDNSFEKNKMLEEEIQLRLVTEKALKESAVMLKKATVDKIRAEQDKLAKSAFLSTMSHEIRTPINGIIGIANLLKSENLNSSQQELINTLAFSSNHLLSILTDILDFSKIEVGNLTFDNIQFNLKEICKSVQSLYDPIAKEKGIRLIIHTDDELDHYLNGDSVRLCQILNNLVGNAIKFTDKGEVVLNYNIKPTQKDEVIVHFSIKDTGIGIEQNKLESIFESFSQADRTIASNYGGTGLGLTITKKLIELQGGEITVNSTKNVGSTFSFSLPFKVINSGVYKKDKQYLQQQKNDLKQIRILVAEDNKINAMIIEKFLNKWNVTVHIVVNGMEVLEKLEQYEYDIIMMDLHMPVMDGKTATKIIRSDPNKKYYNIPIIALTADATSDTQKIILDSGFNEYVTKPFSPENLYSVLKQYNRVNN